jgi:hypothetical protein
VPFVKSPEGKSLPGTWLLCEEIFYYLAVDNGGALGTTII